MIGHYLLSLTPVEEDRVLTEEMKHFPLSCVMVGSGIRCLVMVANGLFRTTHILPDRHRNGWGMASAGWDGTTVTRSYDSLCDRFGEPRVNAAIRGRILSNRARRMGLTGPARGKRPFAVFQEDDGA